MCNQGFHYQCCHLGLCGPGETRALGALPALERSDITTCFRTVYNRFKEYKVVLRIGMLYTYVHLFNTSLRTY